LVPKMHVPSSLTPLGRLCRIFAATYRYSMVVEGTKGLLWRLISVCVPVDARRGRFLLQRGLFRRISPQAPISPVLWGPAARFGDIRGYSHRCPFAGSPLECTEAASLLESSRLRRSCLQGGAFWSVAVQEYRRRRYRLRRPRSVDPEGYSRPATSILCQWGAMSRTGGSGIMAFKYLSNSL
jgi:hypothetical protein